jgi:hypothetical protein
MPFGRCNDLGLCVQWPSRIRACPLPLETTPALLTGRANAYPCAYGAAIALPRPDALSPPPPRSWCTRTQTTMVSDMGVPLLEHLADRAGPMRYSRTAWNGDSPNFAGAAFSEVREGSYDK